MGNMSINIPRGVSTSRHVCSEKENNPNNMSVRKIEGGPETELNWPVRFGGARAWGDTDLAW